MVSSRTVRRKIVGQVDILDVVEEAPGGKKYHVIKLRFAGEEFYITEVDKLVQKIRTVIGDFVEEIPEGESP